MPPMFLVRGALLFLLIVVWYSAYEVAAQRTITGTDTITITQGAPVISAITLSNGTSFTIPANASSTIDTLAASCSSGSCAGATFQLATQAGCTSTDNGSFAVSGAHLNIGGTTINDTAGRTICLEAQVTGAANFFQSFTLTGTVVISAINLSNGTGFLIPANPGSTIDTLSATCSSGSCAGATFQLATQAGCTSTNNGSFAVSGTNLNIGGTTINDTNPRTICLEALLVGSPNFFQSFTLNGSGTVISTITLSNGTGFTVPASASSTIDTLSAKCSSGSCAGATFQLATQTGCTSTGNSSFAVSGTNLNIGSTTINDTASRTICLEAQVTGAANFFQSFTLTGNTGSACGPTPGTQAATDTIAAGFNTCALFSDFTASTGAGWTPSFSGSVATLSNWLDCNFDGGTSAVWYFGTNWFQTTTDNQPCAGHAAVVTDVGGGGNQAFQLTLTGSDISPTDAPNCAQSSTGIGTCMAAMTTHNFANNSPVPGPGFYPLGYHETTWRTDQPWTNTGINYAYWTGFEVAPTPGYWLELDFMETLFGAIDSGWTRWFPGGSTFSHPYNQGLGTSGYDPTVYHTVGGLITATPNSSCGSANGCFAYCAYVDGVRKGCTANTAQDIANEYTYLRYLIWWEQAVSSTTFPTTHTYIKNVKVVTCSNQSNFCAGNTYNGNFYVP